MVKMAKNIIGTVAAGTLLSVLFLIAGAVTCAMAIGISAVKTFGFPKKH